MTGVRRIISGGQTGADRGGLDAGVVLKIEVGGWCPRGRRAADGRVPRHYPLDEHASSAYPARTQSNVLDAGATLIIVPHRLRDSPGSMLTREIARTFGRPCELVNHCARAFHDDDALYAIAAQLRRWLANVEWTPTKEGVLNVAGSRETSAPGLQDFTRRLLVKALEPVLASTACEHPSDP